VLDHGTGALNIDGTRIDTDGEKINRNIYDGEDYEGSNYGQVSQKVTKKYTETGRYPANVVFDETEAARLDREVGELAAGHFHNGGRKDDGEGVFHKEDSYEGPGHYGEKGGPSRYFYTSKASRSERTEDGTLPNDHPTVKPLDLMEWVVTLVTAEGQTVLDPFAGSGTTLKAAKALNRRFVGIERQAKYADLARARAGLTPEDPGRFRDDDDQAGLDAF
jgi:site-specific DNA-methyltransferase (adenine-specific)